MGEESGPSNVVARIQAYIMPRRIRLRDFFADFDGHKSGCCSVAQFTRAMDRVGMTFMMEEVDALVGSYRNQGAPLSVEVNYAAFCTDVEQVFFDPNATFGSSTASFTSRLATAQPDRLLALLERLAMLCKTRGVVLKSCYADFERAPGISPARITPRQAGKVTKSQFMRLFPFAERFKPEEIQFLAEAYATESGDVHYQALHDSVYGIKGNEEQPFARSDLILRPDNMEWSHDTLNPMDKLRSKVVEKRVRLYEHFQDFDALRKGTCTVGQVKTVFTILDLTKLLTRDDFDYIVSVFSRADGMFCYREFCADADKDFTTPGLEKNPLVAISMPDSSTTSPGRRNRINIRSGDKIAAIEELHGRIASKVKKERMLLTPAFQDMDKTKRGHVSVSQFGRALVQLNLGLSDAEVELLRSAYCDLGNFTDFNYVEFVRRVDPPNPALLASEAARRQTPRAFNGPLKYFNGSGAVRALDRSFNSMAMTA